MIAPLLITIIVGCGSEPSSATVRSSDPLTGPSVKGVSRGTSPSSNASRTAEPLLSNAAMRLATAVDSKRWSDAETLIRPALLAAPESAETHVSIAKVHGAMGRNRAAAESMRNAVEHCHLDNVAVIDLAVAAQLQTGQLFEAIEMLTNRFDDPSFESASDSVRYKVARWLISFHLEAGTGHLAHRYLQLLIQDRQFDPPLLVSTTDLARRLLELETVEQLIRRNPEDPRLRWPKVRKNLDELRVDEALADLLLIHHRRPDFQPAAAMLGRVLVSHFADDEQHASELERWIRQYVPADPRTSSLVDQSDYWVALAVLSQRQSQDQQPQEQRSQIETTWRCWIEAAQRRPDNIAIWQSLMASLRQSIDSPNQMPVNASSASAPPAGLPDTGGLVDRDALLADAAGRVNNVLQLRDHLFRFAGSDRRSAKEAIEVAQRLLRLGRLWQAEAWSAIAMSLAKAGDGSGASQGFSTNAAPEQNVVLDQEIDNVRAKILRRLRLNLSFQATDQSAVLSLDPSVLKLDLNLDQRNRPATKQAEASVDLSPPVLSERATSLGLNFLGRVGDRVDGPLVPLSQTTGCGGAAIDFDRDGRCDLVLAAADTAIGQRSGQPNVLMRSAGRTNQAATLTNVSDAAGCNDRGYGQGVAAGDFNDDGFADLWLTNLGENRLLRNNGDGTFTDVTGTTAGGRDTFDDPSPRWSTSGVITDVDGDGWADLVATTYASLDGSIDQPCYENGVEVVCHPMNFPAEANQFWRGRGDGTFEEVSDRWNATQENRLGLGVLAGRFDGQTDRLWIANDMMANDLLRFEPNVDEASGDPLSTGQLVNDAVISGVSVDARALTQASMGMTASDLDRDGDLDVYVTGFAAEYNVLHRQTDPGRWEDATSALGLIKPTLDLTGFGTLAMDLNGDGWDELVVTNGHISDFGSKDQPYAQPLQVFGRNRGGTFDLLSSDSLGDYFASSHVGRAMFGADVNSDGRGDLVVTHSTERVAVLVNEIRTPNHFVALELIATAGPRDAIGGRVSLTPRVDKGGARPIVLHRWTGGYLSTNEPVLRTGVGSAKKLDDVVVCWADDSTESLGTLRSDRHYTIVQGLGVVGSWPMQRSE